jgi:hypothetical protein
MKVRLLLVLFFTIGVSFSFAQLKKTTTEYPLVSIHDIQYIDNVGTNGFLPSVYTGDTVRVRGQVMVNTLVNAETNRIPILYYGSRWGTYIQDTSSQSQNGWAGINVIQNDTSGINQNTFFDLVDTTSYVELTGWIYTYGQTNELILISNPAIPVNTIDNLPSRPLPLQLSLTDFMQAGVVDKNGVKYSGTYVEFNNVISSDRNTSSGAFNINDGNGNSMIVYPQSRYFRLGTTKMPGSTYEPPQDGTPINTIKGIITFYNNGYELLPLYPEDLYITATPPSISNIKRDVVQVNTNQPVTISANIIDLDGTVKSAALHYKIGDANRVTVAMDRSVSDTTLYTATIPGASVDSTLVNFYISAKDNDGLNGYTPSDTVKSNYFYQVLNETLKIRDVQYSPYGSGYSGYNGYYVTLTGVVTADTSDIPGFGTTPLRIYMQDGTGPWTGILIGTRGINGTELIKFKRGDSVTLTGVILENYSVTSIDSITSFNVNSDSNALPEAVTVSTGTIDKIGSGVVGAEQWESVLIDYKNVTVTDDNADGDSGPVTNNYGEIYVNDGSGDTRVELQDGNHHYENMWDANLANDPLNIDVVQNSTFSEIRGILYYSFSYYKLVPRKDDDFVGYVTDVKQDNSETPVSYNLSQNYPNPFNPSTVISYSIPNESNVSLKIYNLLGQEVKTLVDESKAPGTYKVNFNAGDLSSGIYFYSLHAGNFYQVKKMILIK